jgi:hypothetical protein
VNVLAATVGAVMLAAAPSASGGVSPAPAISPPPVTESSSEHRGPPVIVVVAPPVPDPAVTEALSRFRGEAVSVGFEVTIVDGSAASTPAAQMESTARAASAVATVAFVSGGDPRALDIWFTDRATGKTMLGHVSAENESGDRASAVLAVRAVDFLRARMFDFLAARPPRVNNAAVALPAPPPPEAPATIASAPSPASVTDTFPAHRFGVAVGIGVLRSVQGLGTTILPVLRGAYRLARWSSLQVTVGILGSRSRVGAMGGSATVAEDVGMADWVVTWGHARVRPRLSVGAGIHDLRVEGAASAPYTMSTKRRLFLATALSAGFSLMLGQRLSLIAEGGASLLFPEPEVLIAGLDAGHTGRPSLFSIVTMEARF